MALTKLNARSGLTTGKIGQVLSTNNTAYVAKNNNTFYVTGLAVTITPVATSSKCFITWDVQGASKNTNDTGFKCHVERVVGGSVISTYEQTSLHAYTASSSPAVTANLGGNFLDSCNTTSAVTYRFAFCSMANNANVEINNYSGSGYNNSTMTVMEVLA